MKLPPESAAEFEALHAELAAQLERIAWAIVRDWPLASDAAQEAFSLLTQKWPEVLPEHRSGWLVKTVQLVAYGLRRKQLRAQELPERLGRLHGPSSGCHAGRATEDHQHLEQSEQLDQLRVAIGSLPLAQQTVLRMRIADERTFAEIAAELELPLGIVLSRMRLALEKLRKLLS